MKNLFIILIAISFIFSSCKKIDELTQFTMKFDQEATINATIPIPIGNFNIPTPNLTTDSESVFKSNNTHKDLVEQAILKKLTITISSPSHATFSFLESIKVYISADGLNEQLIASKTTISETAKSIELDADGQNLEAYVKKDIIKLRVETKTDEILTRNHTLQIHTEFFIDAKILGI